MNFKCLLAATVFILGGVPVRADKAVRQVIKYENVVLQFPENGWRLDRQEIDRLRQKIRDAKNNGEITRIEAAVWSDHNHPPQGDLPKADQKLAEERLRIVKQIIKGDLGRVEKVRGFNMSRNAHWWGQKLRSDEAELDQHLNAKEESPLEREDFKIIKENGGPSKAVVVLRLKQEKSEI